MQRFKLIIDIERSKRSIADDDTDLVNSLSSILLLAAELKVLFLLFADWARMLFLAMSGAVERRKCIRGV